MTKKQAQKLMEDLGSQLTEKDYTSDLYLSIRGIGSKRFSKCVYHEIENFLFIWSVIDTFLIDRKDIGDFVIIDVAKSLTTANLG